MAEAVKEGDAEDGPITAEPAIGEPATEKRHEINRAGEKVIHLAWAAPYPVGLQPHFGLQIDFKIPGIP